MPTPSLQLINHFQRPLHIDENTPLISRYIQCTSTPSPAPSPPSTFPPPISPPPPLFPRLEPQTPTLSLLDLTYTSAHLPILDGNRRVGAGGVGNPYSEDKRENGQEAALGIEGVEAEMRTKDALRVLEEHIRERIPYTRVASRRMQAVMGVRNEVVFDLPNVRRGYQVDNDLDAGSAARAASRNNHERRRESGLAFNSHSPLHSPQVDLETGKGLREWLLSKGKEFGMRKRECRSISFHDFSPDMRNNSWSNKLLGHYAVGGGREGRERVDYYEVDLPITTRDSQTGMLINATETWIWFLISRPVVSIEPTSNSTHPTSRFSPSTECTLNYHTPANRPPCSSKVTPTSNPASISAQLTQTPPNFTSPIPTSWLVIACPLASTTSYPSTIEEQPSHPGKAKPGFLFTDTRPKGKKIHKRKDLDISQNGLPIFEFNTSSLFNGSQAPFLSVEGIGPYFEGDEYAELSAGEYREAMERWLQEEEGGGTGKPSPYKGQWWKVFYCGVEEDKRRWEEVRGAMGRGKCRVVVRWVEFEAEEGGDADVGMSDGLQGVNGGAGGAAGAGKKIKERLVGRQGRMTRSEVRRRSGLGLSESASGVGIGIGAGLGESSRSRMLGNREVKRGGWGKK